MNKPLTARIEAQGGVVGLAAYEAAGGYRAARRAVNEMTPVEVQKLVTESKLRGRGGAGFHTGLKWSFVRPSDREPNPEQTYLVCNADEMEPGTFKDRYLMEFDPHLLLEGILIGAYAIQANRAYIFIRGEYHQAATHLTRAISEAEARGYAGERVFQSAFGVKIAVHRSAGRYICGEETALLNALEGKRGQPRTKPPFPPVSGAWGRPTVVNNVETLCNLPGIVRYGSEWYRSLGRHEDAGTKLFGVSGRVQRPGLWELPMGTTIREVIEEHAGGMQSSYRLRGILPGGASTGFLVAEHLDLPLDYGTLQAAGSRLGTGTITVVDDAVCPVALLRNLQQFFARESCGFCTPCRDGLPWVEQLLCDIDEGRGESSDLELLEKNAVHIGTPGNTFCLHATGAMEPLVSAMKYFRADFEAHIGKPHCPYQTR